MLAYMYTAPEYSKHSDDASAHENALNDLPGTKDWRCLLEVDRECGNATGCNQLSHPAAERPFSTRANVIETVKT